MAFTSTWHELLTRIDTVAESAMLYTPLSHQAFQIDDIQEQQIIIAFEEDGRNRSLQREQFEMLFHRIHNTTQPIALDRLPANADPYPPVLSLHPNYWIEERSGIIVHSETDTESSLLSPPDSVDETIHTEPDIDLYSDLLLLIDALERVDITGLRDHEMSVLIGLYTLLSDVQRGANDLRTQLRELLVARLHHDQPVSGQYGSLRRRTRHQRTLKDETDVLATLEAAGIDSDRVLGVDPQKVKAVLDVTNLSEDAVFDITESAYVRKTEVNEAEKASQLQSLDE